LLKSNGDLFVVNIIFYVIDVVSAQRLTWVIIKYNETYLSSSCVDSAWPKTPVF